MPTLKLGVFDIPYKTGGKSTGDVAEILEAKYHIFEVFYEEHQDEIANDLTEFYGDALEDLLNGAVVGSNSQVAIATGLKTMFVKFIDSREMDNLGIPGVPTKAAQKGVNHSFAHPYAKSNPERPSFRDTSTFEDAFWAEVEE